MRIRNRSFRNGRPVTQMAAMIDVVFLLLIFFMLTLRIVEPEGEFNVNMAQAGPGAAQTPPIDVTVRLQANPDGSLKQILFGTRNLGNGPDAYKRLGIEMRTLARGGLVEEIEIDADYQLDYAHVVQAVSTCRGRRDPQTGRAVRYFEKIRFAPPRRPS